MAEIRFLALSDAIAIHADSVGHEGGMGGVRDLGLLEAALAMPRQQFGGEYLHPDIASMAAAYLFHLCANHPFHDGNKRVAAMAAFVFLDVNGFEQTATGADFEKAVMRVASSRMTKAELTAWFGQRISKR